MQYPVWTEQAKKLTDENRRTAEWREEQWRRIYLFSISLNRCRPGEWFLENSWFRCLNKRHQEIVNTTTGEIYFLSSFIILYRGLAGWSFVMQQVVNKQTGTHLLEKNQQQKNCYPPSYNRISPH